MAAGRELHLKGMQVMGLYPANSLFMEGYLNTTGTSINQTFQMIKDGGFDIKSDKQLDYLLAVSKCNLSLSSSKEELNQPIFKSAVELRPTYLA